jgi:hypothetical protein
VRGREDPFSLSLERRLVLRKHRREDALLDQLLDDVANLRGFELLVGY